MRGLREARRAIGLVWQSSPRLTVLNGALTLVLSFLPLAGLLLLRRLLDAVAQGGLTGAAQTEAILFNVFLIGLVALASSAGKSLATTIAEMQALEVADYMKTLLHAKSIEMDLEYYENSQYQDTLRRAQQEAPTRPVRIVNSLMQVAQSGLSLLVIGVFLAFTLHWGFFVVLLVAAAPGMWVRARQSRETYDLQRRQTALERAVGYVDTTLTNEWFAKELRLFGLGGFFSKKSQALRRKLREEKIAMAKRRTAREAVTHIFWIGALYGSIAVVALKAAGGGVTIGSLVMFYQALQRGQSYLQDFLYGMASLYEHNLFLKNLSEFLDLKPRIGEVANPKPIAQPIREGLVFENVSFTYPGKETPTLRNVSFTLRPGQKIALVGENGSGKTTLVKLMCRLYDPTEGRILLDGVDLREVSIGELRRQFSVIFQDFVRYHLSLAENIGLGDLKLMDDREKIVEAARRSGADSFIEKMPQGYDTKLGRIFYEGEEISGGEWQKVAVARAFLRETPFIIMDEPSSAMDARAEYELFARFAEMSEGRATVLISHRLSTVRMADAILMMEHGRIVEQGSHDDLVARGGVYARLFELQAQNYR
jgi:ATP-binding cassette subfamily B protein